MLLLAAAVAGCGRKPPATGGGADDALDRVRRGSPQGSLTEYKLAGSIATGLKPLRAVAVGGSGEIFAGGGEEIRVFDPATGSETRRWKVGGELRALSAERRPQAADSRLWAALASGVEVYDESGKALAKWSFAPGAPGAIGLATSIAVSPDSVYVADYTHRVVHRFTREGVWVNDIGRRDKAAGLSGLHVPSPHLDCAVDSAGRVIVTNPGNQRVETYTPTGDLVSGWGEPGIDYDRFSGCCNPTDIALLPDGSVATSEKGIPRVKVYDAAGRMKGYIGAQQFSEDAAGMDLAVDERGRIYVADPPTGRVLVFEEGARGR